MLKEKLNGILRVNYKSICNLNHKHFIIDMKLEDYINPKLYNPLKYHDIIYNATHKKDYHYYIQYSWDELKKLPVHKLKDKTVLRRDLCRFRYMIMQLHNLTYELINDSTSFRTLCVVIKTDFNKEFFEKYLKTNYLNVESILNKTSVNPFEFSEERVEVNLPDYILKMTKEGEKFYED